MFVTNWISTTKIQKISEITNFFRHYFLSRTEVYCFSEWTTKRFKYNNLVCLSSEICQMLKLTFDIDRLAYIFANEEVSASFICDDSTFFFLRKDIVDKLLKMKKSYLYIQMEEHRSITGKLPPNIEEPEMCYNKRVSYNSYSGISTRKSIDE